MIKFTNFSTIVDESIAAPIYYSDPYFLPFLPKFLLKRQLPFTNIQSYQGTYQTMVKVIFVVSSLICDFDENLSFITKSWLQMG